LGAERFSDQAFKGAMMIGDEKGHQQQAYSFLIIFSAANLASDSDAESSGVTMLDIVLP